MSQYLSHLNTLKHRYQLACEHFHLDAIILHSGSQTYYANDDMTHVYHPYAFAQQWLPYDVPADTWIIISANGELTLKWQAKKDFWHVIPTEPEGDWTADWKVEGYENLEWLDNSSGRLALLSPTFKAKTEAQKSWVNSESLVHWLNYDRAVKTDWELAHIKSANHRAAAGHRAAAEAFFTGASEMEIHFAYLQATHQQQADEPYSSIIALNEGAAVLHYERKNSTRPKSLNTLLIDAGVKQNGYASDITRTTTTDSYEFKALVSAVDRYQQVLNDMCVVGKNYSDIHDQAIYETAKTLNDIGICKLSIEEQIAKNIPQIFFPHGIGHLLGLQVHDVGGHQQDQHGTIRKPAAHAPFLRLNRNLQPGTVVTIEPGIYFIPMLLEKMQAEIPEHGCDLNLIEKLKPFGGVRIEDNVIVTDGQPINATRDAFEALT